MPRAKSGSSRELRMLSPDLRCTADRDKRHRKYDSSQSKAKLSAYSQPKLSAELDREADMDAALDVVSDADSDYDSDDLDASDEESEAGAPVPPLLPAGDGNESDSDKENKNNNTSNNNDDADSINDDVDVPPPFVTPPPPVGKGNRAFATEVAQNVILPLDVMMYFIQEQMVCPTVMLNVIQKMKALPLNIL